MQGLAQLAYAEGLQLAKAASPSSGGRPGERGSGAAATPTAVARLEDTGGLHVLHLGGIQTEGVHAARPGIRAELRMARADETRVRLACRPMLHCRDFSLEVAGRWRRRSRWQAPRSARCARSTSRARPARPNTTATHLAAACPALTPLRLARCAVSDSGAAELASLRRLQLLDLSGAVLPTPFLRACCRRGAALFRKLSPLFPKGRNEHLRLICLCVGHPASMLPSLFQPLASRVSSIRADDKQLP